MSTNSDPNGNEAQSSLLARITARRKHDETGMITPTATTAMEGGSFQFGGHKPTTGSLRVDTNVEAPAASKQNKSAYPTFASTQMQALSPGPVTAGPDFGRHLGIGNANVTDANTVCRFPLFTFLFAYSEMNSASMLVLTRGIHIRTRMRV